MRSLKVGDFTVDRCEKCSGIWLDQGERLKIMQHKDLIAGLDTGSAKVGEAMDTMTDIQCPRCGGAMDHVQHPEQKHIGFEVCSKCHGSFFDAGELSDLSEFTLLERMKSLLGAGN